MRTTYTDHGYEVSDAKLIFLRYLGSWLLVDVLSSLPFSLISGLNPPPSRNGLNATSVLAIPTVLDVRPIDWICLLRVLALGRCLRFMSWIRTTRLLQRNIVLGVLQSSRSGC